MKKLFFFLSLALIPANVFAQEVPDSHEIIQKLSAAPMMPVPKTTQISMSIPAPWESSVKPGESVIFRVPFHPGVFGRIEKLSEISSLQDDLSDIGNLYHTEFKVESQSEIETPDFKGYQAVIQGRLGGEIWKLRLYSGMISNKFPVRFYAQAPDFWFHVYIDFFDDIMKSVHAN